MPVNLNLRTAEDTRDFVHQTVEALSTGKLAVLPTETIYGVAARALDAQAVIRLVEVKGRQGGHALTLAIKSAEEMWDYVPERSRLAERLARRCWPGPLTLVVNYDASESLVGRLPEAVRRLVCPGKTVGLRVPDHKFVLEVLRMHPGPLVLSSANRSGEQPAITAEEALRVFGDEVDVVVTDGPARLGRASSVVQVEDERYSILREGALSDSAIRRLSCPMILFVCTGNTCRSPLAEGFARKLLAERLKCSMDALEERGIIVSSAGIGAIAGGRASHETLTVLREWGVNLEDHQTQPLAESLVRHADVIYTMGSYHRETIVSQWPSAAPRTMLLSPDGLEIADPIGGSLDEYRACAKMILGAVEKSVESFVSELLPQA